MVLTFKEIDSFLKGNGKPFNAGENIYREIDLTTINVNLYSILARIDSGALISKIFFYDEKDNDLIIPIPKDLALFKEKLIKAKLKLFENILDDKEKHILIFDETGKLKEIKGYLYLKNLEYYIFNENNLYLDKDNIINISQEDVKAGVKLNRSNRNVETRNLYFQKSVNLLHNISILCETNISNISSEIHTLGGEGKTSKIDKIDININEFFEKANINYDEIKSEIKKTGYFKIILLSPTNYPPEIAGAKCVAQIIGKFIPFSGWFNVYYKNEKIASFPSRLFNLIPAGSVFYYKLEDENEIDNIFEKYWLKPSFCISEYPYFEKLEDGTNPLGFGFSIIGVASIEKQEE